MCGGIAFKLSQIPRKELNKRYNKTQIENFEKKDEIQSYFWDPEPVLPVNENGDIRLVDWGNRSSDVKFPKTGWAKQESIDKGKWSYLNPKKVIIPVEKGYEKGIWFNVKSNGFEGLLVGNGTSERVYMKTKKADSNYLKLTKHNRQPIEV